MELSHIGANRKEVRTTAFTGRSPEISIDESTGNLVLIIKNADGMGTKGQYDYRIKITPSDLTKIIKTTSTHRSIFHEGPLRTELESAVSALLRLMIAASALPFQVMPSDLQLQLQKAMQTKKHLKSGNV